MGSAVEKLTGLANAEDRFDISHSDLRELQIEAMNERFEERREQIRLIAMRAEETGVAEVRSFEDAVPLLLPHTAYKSYPEGWLRDARWDRLGKWLGTVSSHPAPVVDLDGVSGIDDWIDRLGEGGCFVSCSSGTTGKSAMLVASQADLEWSKIDTVNVFSWGSGVKPARDRMLIGCAPVANAPKNKASGDALAEAFANPEWERFYYPAPPITVGSLTQMVLMRRAIADGTAKPGQIAEFERESKRRQEAMDGAVEATADAIIEHRDRKLFLAGMWSGLYNIAKVVREKGCAAKDFHPDNCIYVAGGLKRAQLPGNYQEFVHDTFNIPPGRHFQNYSMQELNTGMPRCREGGRYHIPPWLVPLPLDKLGETLVTAPSDGEFEARAAFFDLSLDGRWGGVISGDRVFLDYGPCSCGAKSPSIANNIARYADLEGDDKIGCAGTVDAYVRGLS